MIHTRDVIYVRKVVNFNETSESKCIHIYILYIFGKIELSSIHATYNYLKMHYLNGFQEAKTYLYIGHWKYGRNMTFMDLVSDRTFIIIV